MANIQRKVNRKKAITIYTWTGVNRKGKKVNGELPADNVISVKAQLRKQGIVPGRIRKKPKPLFNLKDKKISSNDIAIISRQIATMLNAGVPLVQTIELITKGSKNANIQQLLGNISAKLNTGIPLSQCLREYPEHFDDLYCDLVASGEQSGALETIYDRIATYKEKAESLKAKIKKAMVYPLAVIAVAIAVTLILLIFVVPTFKDIFSSFGAELPAFTLFVIHISEFIQAYWHFALLGILIFIYLFRKAYIKSAKLRDSIDRKILHVPVVGSILKKAAIARYTRTLSTTFAAGVPLVDALESAAGASGNAVFRDVILDIRSEVSSGVPMNIAMRISSIFPEMVTQMVAIGEESGTVDDMLAKVATVYEEEVDNDVDNLTTLLEPFIMVVLGILIGGLIIAMYLPIFAIGKIV